MEEPKKRSNPHLKSLQIIFTVFQKKESWQHTATNSVKNVVSKRELLQCAVVGSVDHSLRSVEVNFDAAVLSLACSC